MIRRDYHREAVDMLGWIFNWDRHVKNGHYRIPDGFQIHHIDGDYTNNSLDNLVILTIEEHMKTHEGSRIERLRKFASIGGKKTGGRNKKSVLCVETGVIYESAYEASEHTGATNKNISSACKGRRKTAGGFHWKFI